MPGVEEVALGGADDDLLSIEEILGPISRKGISAER
jgi:hypothetical protein